MSLILVNKNELVVGMPTPWPIFDWENKPLLEAGGIIRDENHKLSLLSKGACHELAWETPKGSTDESSAVDAKTEDGTIQPQFTFDDMKLRVEDKLQLEPPPQLSKERLLVKVIGFIRGISLLVSAPMTTAGQRLHLLENESVVMRSFSGKNAFAFAGTVLKVNVAPYEYLHLSFPKEIQGLAIRKTARVKTRIITAVQNTNSNEEDQISAIISDISATGVSLETRRPLGEKGDTISMAFRVHLHNVEAFLSVKGVIRAALNKDTSDLSTSENIHYGIELQDLQPNDSVILQSMIYQQMIENPQKLV
ncbi:MAG: flagellar brake protein [Gallionellaceae bacterium]